MKKLFLIIFLASCGCDNDPKAIYRVDNNNFKLELLFTTPDSCKVYRFEDGGYDRYFVECPTIQQTSFEELHGKSHEPVDIPTAYYKK